MTTRLSDEEVQHALEGLQDWSGDGQAITKRYDLGDFTGAMGFVTKVALAAERLNHHPDIAISWATVDLKITSHADGGVTQECIQLAERIDQLS